MADAREQPEFWKEGPNHTASSRGFSIRSIDRHHILYEKPPYALTIEVEDCSMGEGGRAFPEGTYCLAIYLARSQHWDPPHEKKPLTEEERETLRKDLRDSYAFEGFPVDIDGTGFA